MSLVKKAVLSVAGKALFRSGTVSGVEELGPRLRRVTVQAASLRDVQWVPGDKIQVDIGGWELRTFTPFAWDAARGRFEFIVYGHAAEAPASNWVRQLSRESLVRFFGPRRSIDVTDAPGDLLMIGDETSLGIACALASAAERARRPPGLVFEVSSPDEFQPVVEHLGLRDARLVKRLPEDAHVSELESAVREMASRLSNVTMVFTGRARTIQDLRAHLRTPPSISRPTKAKAYWAEGKVGLD